MSSKEIYSLFSDSAKGVAIDSRKVKKGDLFFALRGDNFDGNRFAEDAITNGAFAAVIDNPDFSSDKTILVDDVLACLQDIALIHRKTFDIPVLAITGTNGKTTTKELISTVLSSSYLVHYTRGNLNNHIGVPITILECSRDTELMVLEMGANHVGEISELCKIALPGYGMITNIGKAHLEGFGSFEGVVSAKSELYRHLSENNGSAIYNDSNPILDDLIRDIGVRSIPYSKPDGKLATEVIGSDGGAQLQVNYGGLSISVKSSLYGDYNIENIVAAFAVGIHFGIDLELIVKAIEDYKVDNNRSQVLDTVNNKLLCDAYNANPDSMMNALRSFIKSEHSPKTIILGDMLELGAFSEMEHLKIVNYLSDKRGLDIYLVGKNFMKSGQNSGFGLFANTQMLYDHLERNPIKDNFVLLKGSRGIGLERLFSLL